MAKDDCSTDCGWRYFLNGGARARCRRSKDCSCKCGSLKAINPNLFDGCVDECQAEPRPIDAEDYKCNFVGAETLFSYYGIEACGFSMQDSSEYQAAQSQSKPFLIASIVIGTLLIILALNTIIR